MKYSVRIFSIALLISLCATQTYAGKKRKEKNPALLTNSAIDNAIIPPQPEQPMLPEAPKAPDLSATMILVQQTKENQVKLHQKAFLMKELNQEEAALEAALLALQEKKNRLKTMGRQDIATLESQAKALEEKIAAKETDLTTVENSLTLLCTEISKNNNKNSLDVSNIEQLQYEQEKLRNEINDLATLRAKILKNIARQPKPASPAPEISETAPEEAIIEAQTNPIEQKTSEQPETLAPLVEEQKISQNTQDAPSVTQQEKNEQSSWSSLSSVVYGWTFGLFSNNKQ